MTHEAATVFSVTRLGDLVLATTTFDVLRERHGALRLVTSPQAAPLVSEDARVTRVDVVRSTSPIGWRAELLRILARTRGPVVNLELYEPRWRLVRRAARWWRKPAVHLDLPALRADEAGSGSPPRHVADWYGDVLGVARAPLPSLAVGPRATAEAERVLARRGVEAGEPLVALHPGSHEGWTAKRAPAALFAAVARAAGPGWRPVLVGGAGEGALCREVVRDAGADARAVDLSGALGVAGLAALLRRARLFVGGDSGPLKVAEGVGTPTLSLWTVTRPERLAPRGPGHAKLVLEAGDPPLERAARMALELLSPERAAGSGGA